MVIRRNEWVYFANGSQRVIAMDLSWQNVGCTRTLYKSPRRMS